MKIRFGITRRISLPLLLLYKLFLVLVLMSFTRWLFYFFNTSQFDQLGAFELFKIMRVGLRFDISALAMVNIPIFLLLAIPLAVRYNDVYQKITHYIYVFLNSLALALNLIDVIYFRYISKRTTSELFQFFGNGDENVILLTFRFLIDFWYIFIIWFLLIYVLYKAGKYFVLMSPQPVRKFSWYIWQTVVFQLWLVAFVFMIRGGGQLKPINLVTAAKYTTPENMALVLNTPFTIIKTYKTKQLKPVTYFDANSLDEVYSPVHQHAIANWDDTCYQVGKRNIVILILESFGREHIGFYNTKRELSYTPFLDSILAHSIVFTAWANGKRSIEALPSIMAGLPSLMHIDYPTSHYISNNIHGLGRLLQHEGYSSAFFHGGSNGTMSFDAFAYAAGFQRYLGRNEYNNEADFDGQWGIYDEPFLQFAANEIDSMPRPFLAGIFTLSSHHPYSVPDTLEHSFPSAANEIQRSIAYTDWSLKQFFAKAESMPWFNNTLFVITADHTSEDTKIDGYGQMLANYAIPVAFYIPGNKCNKISEQIAQQTDIMPSLLALIGYPKPFVAFGNNLFDTTQRRYSISFQNGIYQFIIDGYVLHFNGNETVGFYNLATDPLLEKNLVSEANFDRMRLEMFLKGIIQQYNHRMIHNELSLIE